MEVGTPTGASVSTGKNETLILVIAVIAILGIIVFILWKSGIFKLANTAAGAASEVVKDTINLPQNLITLASDVPDVIKTAEQNLQFTEIYGTSSPTPTQAQQTSWDDAINGMPIKTWMKDFGLTAKVYNMIRAVHSAIPTATPTNWGSMAVQAGLTFDSNGNVINGG